MLAVSAVTANSVRCTSGRSCQSGTVISALPSEEIRSLIQVFLHWGRLAHASWIPLTYLWTYTFAATTSAGVVAAGGGMCTAGAYIRLTYMLYIHTALSVYYVVLVVMIHALPAALRVARSLWS